MDEETAAALIEYLLSGGNTLYAPSLGQADLSLNYGQIPPDVDKYGNVTGWGLDQENTATTLYGKRANMLGDPMVAAMSGPGAFAPGAFNDVMGKPVPQPGMQKLQYYLAPGRENTIEYLIADEIMNNGGTAMSANAMIQDIINGPDSEMKQLVISSLPSVDPSENDLINGAIGKVPDTSAVYKFASDLENSLITDPRGTYQDPATGDWYNPEPSPAAKFYLEQGLPLPTDRYGPETYLGGQNMADIAAMDQRSANVREKLPQAQAAMARLLTQEALGIARGRNEERQRLDVENREAAEAPYFNASMNRLDPRMRRALYGDESHLRDEGAARAPGGRNRPMMAMSGPVTEKEKQGARNRSGMAGDMIRNAMTQLMAEKAAIPAERKRLVGADYGARLGQMQLMNQTGRTPLNDALMQRRMALIAGGLQGTGYLPGR